MTELQGKLDKGKCLLKAMILLQFKNTLTFTLGVARGQPALFQWDLNPVKKCARL